LLDDDRVDDIRQTAEDEVASVIEAAEAVEAVPEGMFADAYAEQPPRVREQLEQFRRLRERHGDGRLTRDE
jgi:TPP-dependent pyruvate/acetoin dehydrogenase alpha subunit